MKIQAAPVPPMVTLPGGVTGVLSAGPPTIAVLPSADRATALPCQESPAFPLPTSFAPCWKNCASADELNPEAMRMAKRRYQEELNGNFRTRFLSISSLSGFGGVICATL